MAKWLTVEIMKFSSIYFFYRKNLTNSLKFLLLGFSYTKHNYYFGVDINDIILSNNKNTSRSNKYIFQCQNIIQISRTVSIYCHFQFSYESPK